MRRVKSPATAADTTAPMLTCRSALLACSAASWAFSSRTLMPLRLNTSTARAISPISSRRAVNGTSTSRSPPASTVMLPVIRPIGRAIARAPNTAEAINSSTMAAAMPCSTTSANC